MTEALHNQMQILTESFRHVAGLGDQMGALVEQLRELRANAVSNDMVEALVQRIRQLESDGSVTRVDEEVADDFWSRRYGFFSDHEFADEAWETDSEDVDAGFG